MYVTGYVTLFGVVNINKCIHKNNGGEFNYTILWSLANNKYLILVNVNDADFWKWKVTTQQTLKN